MSNDQSNSGASPCCAPSPTNELAPKTWKRGTLVYTSGGLVMLFIWLLWGDFTWSMRARAVGPTAALMFKSFGFSDFMYTLICVGFPRFTDIFLCPMVSYISDRYRSRLGRRIPFLIFTTPFIVTGLAGLGFTSDLGGWICNIIGVSPPVGKLIVFSIFWIMLDFGTDLTGALSSALINDVVPAEMLGRFFALFRAVSLLAGIIFNFFFMGMIETHVKYIFVGVAVLYAIGLGTMCWRVKEGEYPPVDSVEAAKSARQHVFGPVATYFRQSFSLSYYRWVISAMVLAAFVSMPFNIFSIFYAKSLNMDMAFYGKLIAVSYLISFVLSYFLGSLADRFHPLRASTGALFLYLGAMLLGYLTVKDARTFGVTLVIHTVFSGCYATLSASLGARLFPRALFAQFNSAYTMIFGIANVIAGPCLGYCFDLLDKNYRYSFLFGMGVTLIAILAMLKVYSNFTREGGLKNYTPPDPEKKQTAK